MVSSSQETPSFPENLAAINKLIASSLDVLLNSNSTNQTNIIQPYVRDNIYDSTKYIVYIRVF